MTDDVERIAKGLTKAQRLAVRYHGEDGRGASCGDMGTDMSLLFGGLADFDGGRLKLTPLGLQVRQYLERNRQ